VTEWDPDIVRRFEEYLQLKADRKARHDRTAEVGDTVETPDGRQWLVVRCPPSDELDLQNEQSETLTVPREFARVITKA